jgi:hypothetical protein
MGTGVVCAHNWFCFLIAEALSVHFGELGKHR